MTSSWDRVINEAHRQLAPQPVLLLFRSLANAGVPVDLERGKIKAKPAIRALSQEGRYIPPGYSPRYKVLEVYSQALIEAEEHIKRDYASHTVRAFTERYIGPVDDLITLRLTDEWGIIIADNRVVLYGWGDYPEWLMGNAESYFKGLLRTYKREVKTILGKAKIISNRRRISAESQ